MRERRNARGGGGGDRPHARGAAGLRRDAHGGQRERGATAEVLERAQERLSGQRPHQPDYMCMDSTIPRKRLADILLAIAEMEKKYRLRCCNVFHAGDGNLHPLILFDANDPDQLHRCEQFGADILETSVALGGTVTGEHGVGVEKLNSMCVQFSPENASDVRREARVRPRRHAEPRQGDPDAAPLRRVRAYACEEGLAAVSGAGAVLMASGGLNFDGPVAAIEQAHAALAEQASRAVNVSLTLRNWMMGCHIVEFEQARTDRAAYGGRLLDSLALWLQGGGLRHVEARELRRFRHFYLTYPQSGRRWLPNWPRPRRP